jgi:translation initiation factor IF-3
MDRERREAEAKETGKPVEINEVETEAPANGGLFANVKGGEELLKKLQDSNEE